MVAGFRERNVPVQAGIIRIADRTHRRKAVERTTQHDHHEARVTPGRSMGTARQMGSAENGAT